MISSLNNANIKSLIQLQKKSKYRYSNNIFIVEGIKMFNEAKTNGLIRAYISESFYKDKSNTSFLENINYDIVADNIFKQISDTQTPQGILAVVNMPKHNSLDILKHQNAKILFLEDVRDPGNMGTIIRTAEGAGITGVIISKGSVDIYNPKVIRSTMGSIYRVNFAYVDNFIDTLNIAKQNKVKLYAAHLQGKKYYNEEDYNGKIGILIGNEANGLSNDCVKLADSLIKIPMCGKVESLNVAIASGIIMYEVLRQSNSK